MKYKIILIVLVVFSISMGCQKGDGEKDYGFPYIYMPQAMVSGGLDNYYSVPAGGGEYSYNFNVEEGKLNVILGVLRSGKVSNEAYSVSVNSMDPSADELAAVGAALMPSGIYTLPQTVEVPADKSGEAFYLSVDAEALKSGAYDGQKLAVIVEISNPSNFELAEDGTSVVVILDVNSIKEFL